MFSGLDTIRMDRQRDGQTDGISTLRLHSSRMIATRDNNEVCQFRAAVAARFYRSCNSVAVVNVRSALVVTVA